MKKKCEVCGKEFQDFPYKIKHGRRFCSVKCRGLAEKKKFGVEMKCPECGKKFMRYRTYAQRKGLKFCSRKCANKYHSVHMRLNGNPAWKGNKAISRLDRQIRRNFKYRQWRDDVFTRDDYTCQICGIRGGEIHAHHLKEFSVILKQNKVTNIEKALKCEELWNINNGITWHKNYHMKYHNLTKINGQKT